ERSSPWFGEKQPRGLGRSAPWFGEKIAMRSHSARKDFTHWTFKKTVKKTTHKPPCVCGMTLHRFRRADTMRQSLTSIAPRAPQQTARTPLSILRTETVLSRFPIHLLAKRGRIAIAIRRTNARGAVDLRWDVSYNERY